MLTVRPATGDDFDVVFDLLIRRIEWLRERGLDQWSTWEKWRDKMGPAIEAGNVWLLLDDDDAIGTISVEFSADRELWTAEEAAEPAAYVSKLAVRTDRAGAELGALLLAWAGEHAYRHGCLYLRLDAWKTNEQLHTYYVDRGWKHLRISAAPHRNSGALFQRPAERMEQANAARIRQYPPLPTLQAEHRAGGDPDAGGPSHGNWHPGHTHNGGVTVIETWSPQPRPAMFVDWMRYLVTERDGKWALASQDGGRSLHVIAQVVDATWPLVSGTNYVISHEGKHPSCRMVLVTVRRAEGSYEGGEANPGQLDQGRATTCHGVP